MLRFDPALYPVEENNYLFRHTCSSAPMLCITCGARTETYYIKEAVIFKYNEIQAATENFSKENLLGEGGYGHVYKGQLNNGQLIAAKVRKEESSQGFAEFHSEVYVLSFARHKNIVMLLGYCSKENINILVYEYICNKSLYWHLFGKSLHCFNLDKRLLFISNFDAEKNTSDLLLLLFNQLEIDM